MPFWLLLLVIFFVVAPSVTDVSEYRSAIAGDIDSGKIKMNDCVKKHLALGDTALSGSDMNGKFYNGYRTGATSWDSMLFFAFNAKVHYERARLCSELDS